MRIFWGRLTVKPMRNVIDLHCDSLSVCHQRKTGLLDECLQLSPARLPDNLRLCQAMAVFMPDDLRGNDAVSYFDSVYKLYQEQLIQLELIAKPVESFGMITQNLDYTQFSAFLTVEGGSVLAGDIARVEKLRRLGVRMMTLTWNAENELCGGAATDLGFTGFGRAAVAEMERVGMIVDCSHISDRGFWELCEFAEKPFVASHSNLRSVCGHRRNLTDDMFREISRRGGVVGLNYYRGFIREDGEHGSAGDLLRHVHRFLEIGGEKTLALGSDFDGADMPDYISGVEKLGELLESFERSGVPPDIVDAIAFGNAERYLRKMGESCQ